MNVSKRFDGDPSRMRVLAQERETPLGLQQQRCHRCGKTWWPRRPKKPLRCPLCKSPYWDRPRQRKPAAFRLSDPTHRDAFIDSLRREMDNVLGRAASQPENRAEDRSLTRALQVLKEMKTTGRTWQEMAERMEREFGTRLDKDQLKALVR